MNASDLTFGVEIETIAPDRAVTNDGLRIGPYKRGIQVPYLPAGWKSVANRSAGSITGFAAESGLGVGRRRASQPARRSFWPQARSKTPAMTAAQGR